jgi:cysteine synthase
MSQPDQEATGFADASRRQNRVYNDVFEMLPGVDNPTPLVRIQRVNPVPEFRLYAKLEWYNPFGSVKDRAAWSMLQELEAEGQLSDQRGIVEPTSGNTGISLAAMSAVRGYPMRAVVPSRVPLEKKLMLRMAGAELSVVNDELCPSPGMGEGSINMAKTYAKAQSHRYVLPNQYENEANVQAHIDTTGPEIWNQTGGEVSHVFLTLGTCGTVTGLGRYLRERNPDVKIVAVQPSEGHDVPGIRNLSQLAVSKLFDPGLVNEILEIDFHMAWRNSLALFRQEGLRAGPSSGLVLEGAREVIERDRVGTGVMIFPDDLFKYTAGFAKHMPELLEGTMPP